MNTVDIIDSLPYLTTELPGIGGTIKNRAEDFFVEELALYPASGEGTHVYAQIEKKGLSTPEAIAQLAQALGVPRMNIGYAGLKDTRALARQWLSLEHIDPRRFLRIEHPRMRVLQVTRHSNKIKLGHLAGNRFAIRVRQFRGSPDEAAARAGAILDHLARQGTPNYFGPQRFGNRSDGHLLGQAIIKGRIDDFVDLFLGRPNKTDLPVIFAARTCYENGQYEKARDSWPGNFRDQRRALGALARSKNPDKKKGYNVIDKNLKRFLVSAFQSQLFNEVLAGRMPHIDRLLLGDMAWKHDNGACFRVEDAAVEQDRCDRFAISPTGPLFGYNMTELTGPAGEIENPILGRHQLLSRDFRQMGYYKVRGARRPLRFQPRQHAVVAGADDLGPFVELRFELDPGCYATTLLREITKVSDLK